MLAELIRDGRRKNAIQSLSSGSFPLEELNRALAEACRIGYEDVVERLLLCGASPNAEDRGRSLLSCAVEHQRGRILEILLDHGADVHWADERGFTALHLAVDVEADSAYQLGRSPVPMMTSILLRHGADPHRKDESGATAYNLAEDYEYAAALDLFEEHARS